MILLCVIAMLLSQISPEMLRERALFGRLARERLLEYARLTMPLPQDPLNPRQSRYKAARHHRYIAENLEGLSRKEFLRLMLQVPYRHGKTELAVRRFVPWLLGKYPDKSGIVVTHTDSLAWEHGRDVRNCLQGSGHKLTFGNNPLTRLREDSQSRDRLQVEGGGTVQFTGRGGLGAGFGADWIIFDDFFKNSEEARSKATRDHAFETYISDCKTRLNDSTGWVLIIGTRRHVDDAQGRIIDPRNEHYDPREAARWRVVRLPALSEGPGDPLGRPKDEPLWPEKFPFEFWDEQRTHKSELVRDDFEVQGQCNPHLPQGKFFKRDWWSGKDEHGRPLLYQPGDLPKYLRIYTTSDHAITEDQKNDATVLLPFGVDERGHVWILPDAQWFRYEATDIVDAMLAVMRKHRPLRWWAEREHISKSILPFLRRRQMDEGVFGYIEESAAVRHPEIRAWSIRGLMAMKRVHFPVFAPWWGAAEFEMIEFPNSAHDDFVSALSHAGMGLEEILAARGPEADNSVKPGTLAWVRKETDRSAIERTIAENLKGW